VRPLPVQLALTFQDSEGTEVGTMRERSGLLVWLDDPFPGLGDFTFRARGRLRVTESGEHLFRVVQAGRACLSVGGEVVFDGFAAPPGPGTDLFGFGSEPVDVLVHLDAGHDVEVVVDYSTEGASAVRGVQIAYQAPEPEDLLDRAVSAAARADVAVVVVGTTDEWESEGHDRASLGLPGRQDELVRRVCAANPRTVVVVNAGAPVQLDWSAQPAALLMAWLGGQEMAPALVDVLYGAEPAGRLPVTMPLRIEHTPAFGAFPGENHHVSYAEGLLLGYRWYDSRHLPTAFAFGQGGSYTTFAWSAPRLTGSGTDLTVTLDLTNTGSRRGAEVVQLYVEPPAGPLFRPRRELKGFVKAWADPGQTVTVSITLDERSFACWDPGSTETAHLMARLGDGVVVPAGTHGPPRPEPGWRVFAGTHLLHLARSVADVVSTLEAELPA
jgi:beta-glucosidase